ncbi:hypothetical protein [Streptomyces mirabilis]
MPPHRRTSTPHHSARLRRLSHRGHVRHIVHTHFDADHIGGFAAARELDAIAPGIVLFSLPGHTRGHACVAVDTRARWLLHSGDAFYHHGTLDGRTRVPAALRAMERMRAGS